MRHIVNFSTRLINNHVSATDSVFVHELKLSSCIIFPLSKTLSNHDAQSLIIEKYFVTVNKINNKLKNKHKSRLITHETINYFSEQLSYKTWEEEYHNIYVNSAFNKFYILFKHLQSKFPCHLLE